jgi:hypothetical protein
MSQAATTITAEDLSAAAQVKVFFGHQSVGMNLIDGTAGVYAARGLAAPEVIQVDLAAGPSALPGGAEGFLAHAYIGRNEEPMEKIHDFDAALRGGLAHQIDVALMKLCYVDITSHTDVEALLQHYRGTLAALERDFPEVTFLHVTTPLTTELGLKRAIKGAIKKMLGRAETNRADNAARERMNRLMRTEYGPDRLFDLAAAESTAPDGTRVSGRVGGQPYHALYDGYASDDGHLDAAGSQHVVAGLLGLVARAAGK